MTRLCLTLMIFAIGASAEIKVTYLANEGVLVTAGPSKVLVDALFREGTGDYLRHTPQVQARLEGGKAPFDGVCLALATHHHLDHWDAGAITQFLRSSPDARFASTPRATEMMPSALRPRIQALWPDSQHPAKLELPCAQVEAVPLAHGPTMQNLAYRIEIGGSVVIHLGDADPSVANLERLAKWSAPDVLLTPFWWLSTEESRAFLDGRWKPKAIIAIHFGARDVAQAAPGIQRSRPGVWAATIPGESRIY